MDPTQIASLQDIGTVGVMLLMFYYQREDKKQLISTIVEQTKAQTGMQAAIEKLSDKLDQITK